MDEEDYEQVNVGLTAKPRINPRHWAAQRWKAADRDFCIVDASGEWLFVCKKQRGM